MAMAMTTAMVMAMERRKNNDVESPALRSRAFADEKALSV